MVDDSEPANSKIGEIVEFEHTEGTRFRAVAGELVNGSRRWRIEYRLKGWNDWAPRGSFEERDGRFHCGDQSFSEVRNVLMYRAGGR